MIWILTIAVIWAVCGILAYGFTLGYFQRGFLPVSKNTYAADCAIASFTAVIGPAGLLVSWLVGKQFKHGLMFRRPKEPASQKLRRPVVMFRREKHDTFEEDYES